MKLLLTSSGITNPSLVRAFAEMLGKPFSESRVVFVPTAANEDASDKTWMVEDMNRLIALGWKSFDVVDISAVSKSNWLPRFQMADVLVFGGGNTFHLMHWFEKSGLVKELPELLKTKIYVGISAGSCITGKLVDSPLQELFADEKNEHGVSQGLGIVDFYIVPHLNSSYFKNLNLEDIRAKTNVVREATYAIDNASAVKVVDSQLEVISEGEWKKFN